MLDIKCFVFESCFLKSSFLDMQVRQYVFNLAYFFRPLDNMVFKVLLLQQIDIPSVFITPQITNCCQ